MERIFVNEHFKYVEVIPISNGATWSIDAICRQIGTAFTTKNMDADYLVVWIDKERQKSSNEEFCNRIRDALTAKGAVANRVAICIPDRMTENVILADETLIKEEFSLEEYEYNHNGKNGARLLSELYARKNIVYKKTFHVPRLLKKVRLSRAALRCPNVARFLENFDIPCWWFEKTE